MFVTVELFYTLRKYCEERFKDDAKCFDVSIEGRDEISLDELVSYLNIPNEEVGFATINNVKHNWNDPIKDGDKVKVFPVIIAG